MNYIKSVEEFKEIIANNENVFVDFFATWCGPCKMLAPIVEEIANEVSDVAIYKVDVDEVMELASLFNVNSIPTLLYVKNGKTVAVEPGFVPKNVLLEKFKKYFN